MFNICVMQIATIKYLFEIVNQTIIANNPKKIVLDNCVKKY